LRVLSFHGKARLDPQEEWRLSALVTLPVTFLALGIFFQQRRDFVFTFALPLVASPKSPEPIPVLDVSDVGDLGPMKRSCPLSSSAPGFLMIPRSRGRRHARPSLLRSSRERTSLLFRCFPARTAFSGFLQSGRLFRKSNLRTATTFPLLPPLNSSIYLITLSACGGSALAFGPMPESGIDFFSFSRFSPLRFFG